ncbi:MAG: hypothetical protein GX491_07945 [Chloroflexi bacterium]|nr:hypothetical protein [Chloroflexota bacterium]
MAEQIEQVEQAGANGSEKTVKTTALTESTFLHYINVKPAETDRMDFADWAAREQVLLLRSINDKLTFFMVLTIIGLILGLIISCF